MDGLVQVDDLAEWLRSFGVWAVLASLLLSIIIAVIGIVPSLFISGANAVVFGMIPGFMISLLGEVLGAGISFWLYRWGIARLKQIRRENWGWLRRLNETGRTRRFVSLLLARLTPLFPSGVITFAAAVSQMKFIDFMIASLLGKAPSIALETLVGHDLIRIDEHLPRLVTSLLFAGLIFLLLKKRASSPGRQ